MDKKSNPIKIAISQGDFNGIGYEILINCLADSRIMENCIPIFYGSSKVLSYYKKVTNQPNFQFSNIRFPYQAEKGKLNILNIIAEEVKIDVGQSTRIAGDLARMSLDMATESLLRGECEALLTLPINKENIQSPIFNFKGHTEYLTKRFKSEESLMIMVSNNIKIGVMTNHLPLRQVPATVSEDLIIRKLKIFNSSLQRDFGIRMPKIAVLALNPHAGDSGVNGEEDDKIVSPAIKKAYEKENILAFGPFPADGFFGSGNFKNYDGVLSLYHDQGLIAFKLLSFESGVNFTAGLNYIRTSPAHGVAYHLAGTNTASCDSFRHALYLAIDIYKNRKLFEEISANPMQVFDKTNFKETDISKDLQKDEVRDFL